MDLKDVIKSVREKAVEAHNAFHAGHHDVAENYLRGIRAEIIEYEKDKATPAGDVTGANDTASPEDQQRETLAQAPGAEVPRPGVVPFEHQQKPLPASQFQKPNQ